MTPSFGLPARYIIHVAGPGWFGGAERERLLLADCYRRTMGEPQWRRNVTFYRPDGVEVQF